MVTKLTITAFAMALLGPGPLQTQTIAQKTAPQQPAQKKPPPKNNESFLEWVVRFWGVSANPNTLKGGDSEMDSGQVWIADLRSATRKRITTDSDYRSPIFFPDATTILTLKGGDFVRLTVTGGQSAKLYDANGVTKLVGFNRGDPDQVLLLKEQSAGQISVGLLSVSTGKVVVLPYDVTSSRDHQMIEHLEDWQRSYGDKTVYVNREPKHEMSGVVERSNIFVKAPGLEPLNVSQCDSANCGQPALSPDGNQVVFIKAEP